MTAPVAKKIDVDMDAVVRRQASMIGQLQTQTIMQQLALEDAHAEIKELRTTWTPPVADDEPAAKRARPRAVPPAG